MQKSAKNKVFERLIFILFTVLFVGVIALSAVPGAFGMISCSVSTDSMEPQIKKGSYVLTKPIEFKDIQISDVLLFEAPKTGERFVRTVADVYTDENQIVTSGNDSAGLDPMTTAYSCVLGKVVYSIPIVGYMYSFADSLIGKIVIMLFYIVWAAIEIEIYKAKKRGEHPNE